MFFGRQRFSQERGKADRTAISNKSTKHIEGDAGNSRRSKPGNVLQCLSDAQANNTRETVSTIDLPVPKSMGNLQQRVRSADKWENNTIDLNEGKLTLYVIVHKV